MAQKLFLLASAILPLVGAQQPASKENPPKLPTWKCSSGGGCAQQDTSVVLDWGYHWIHDRGSSTSCKTSSGVDPQLCPDEPTCASNCVIEGADYANSGIATSGDALTLHQYVQRNGETSNASPRVYLLGSDGNYVNMKLLNQEVSFDVDVSTLVCGENGALYLSDMDPTGGRNQYNPGGAKYGSGYCDAQCPSPTWRNGTLNVDNEPYCCNEMDLWEANAEATVFTPHACKPNSCDSAGCGFNAYAQGKHNFYGPGMTVDTNKPFTVTTKFLTDDGTASGTLNEIRREYVQDGKVIPNPTGNSGLDSITTESCTSADPYGGLAKMGQALGEGMVFIFSIWNSANMDWLDSGNNGPCTSSQGNPAEIKQNHPNTHVVFSNVKWGDLGTTTGPKNGGGDTGTGSSTTCSGSSEPTTTTSNPPTNTSPSGPAQSHWGQCGGNGWTGPTRCESPYTCKEQNPWYSQCL